VKYLEKKFVDIGYIAKYNQIKALVEQVLADYPDGLSSYKLFDIEMERFNNTMGLAPIAKVG